jgi:hypothetical protein
MIYVKTELGKTALQDKSLGLTPRQRSSFIMFDGKRTVAEVLKLTIALGVTADDLSRLVSLGLLVPLEADAEMDSSVTGTETSALKMGDAKGDANLVSSAPQSLAISAQDQYAKAYPVAVRLTSNLGLRGFRLNLSVESAADLEALKDLAPKIKEAVGVEKFKELENALYR